MGKFGLTQSVVKPLMRPGLAQTSPLVPCRGQKKVDDPMRGRFRIGDDLVVELAETFRLMSDPTRLKIILACRDAPAAVNEMAEKLGISPSLVSHHLRLLRAARLLQADRRGRQVFYVVGDEHIRSMLADMVDHISEEEAPEGEA